MRYNEDFLTELKARSDITDIVSSYVELRGGGRYSMGLCPFHNERTPSFCVYSDTQSYYCFGCGSGGDVITFIKNIEGLDYADAVRFLADKAGLDLPLDGFDDTAAKLRRAILDANKEAARFYHKALFTPAGRQGLEYFTGRRLTNETIRHFGLGYAPDRWDGLIRHMRSEGFTDDVLLAADLAKRSRNGGVIDAFRNRVMFPIFDVRGSVIGFGGRVLDDSKPKYLNTSDTPVYKKTNGVFALNFVKRENPKSIILCEGYMDVISYHQAGFTNAVAGLGTAFTREQAKLLSKYCEEIILSYDADEAGQKATKKAIDILSETELRVKVARLTGGKDSDEIINRLGVGKMRSIIESAVSVTDFELENAKGSLDLSSDEDKTAYLNNAAEIIAGIRNEIKRDVYASALAEQLGVSKDAIMAQVRHRAERLRRRGNQARFRKAASFDENDRYRKFNPLRRQNLTASAAEETLLGIILKDPELFDKIRDSVDPDSFFAEENKKLWELIASRAENGQRIDLTLLAADLEDDETGYVSKLISNRSQTGMTGSRAEALDCIAIMKQQKALRSAARPGSMTDEEFSNAFKILGKKRNFADAGGTGNGKT